MHVHNLSSDILISLFIKSIILVGNLITIIKLYFVEGAFAMQKIAGTPSVIKQANQLLILELIQKQPGITKPELARATNLSLVTVSRAVDELCLLYTSRCV